MPMRTRYAYESASPPTPAFGSLPAPPGSLGLPGGGRGRAVGPSPGHGGAHRCRRAAGRDSGHGRHVTGPFLNRDGVAVACGPSKGPRRARRGRRVAGGDLSAGAGGRGRGGLRHSALRRAGTGGRGVGRGGAGAAAGRSGGASRGRSDPGLAPNPGGPVDGSGPNVAGTWGRGRERRGGDPGTGIGCALGDAARGAGRRAAHGSRGGAVVQRRRAENRGRHPRGHRVRGCGVCPAVGGGAGTGAGGLPDPRSRGVAAVRHRRTLLAPARHAGAHGLCAVCRPPAGSDALWHCGGGGDAA